MHHDKNSSRKAAYERPKIEDFGTLKEKTQSGGGSPTGDAIVSSS